MFRITQFVALLLLAAVLLEQKGIISRRCGHTYNTDERTLPSRRLEQHQDDIDLTAYVVRLDYCQAIREDDDWLTHYIVFSLCQECTTPEDAQETECLGDYLIELNQYSLWLAQHYKDLRAEYCRACQECGQEEEDEGYEEPGEEEVDCDVCIEECLKIENLEENGYREAADYLKCQVLYSDDDNTGNLYIGATCAVESKSQISLGVFRDADCQELLPSLDPNDYIFNEKGDAMKFSTAVLRQMNDQCVSCANEQDPVPFSNKEVCDLLYTDADKCEDDDNEESDTCAIIADIQRGAYDETGNLGRDSMVPSPIPSGQPTNMPSDVPSFNGMGPSIVPRLAQQLSNMPSVAPNGIPQNSPSPTFQPRPSNQTGDVPSDMPSDVPSDVPSTAPTISSSELRSSVPTIPNNDVRGATSPTVAPSTQSSAAWPNFYTAYTALFFSLAFWIY